MKPSSAHPVLATPEPRDVLGVAVTPLKKREAIELLERLAAERLFTPVAFLNAHSANIASADPAFAAVLQGFLVLPDGIGVDIAARILYGASFPANLNGTDFVPSLLRDAARPLRVGLLGASRPNVENAARELSGLAPQHEFTVVHDGYFTPDEEPAVLERLASVRPDVLLVAMGVPRQEFFIAAKITPQHATLPIAVGALFDFLSGAVPRAPEWMRRARLEWVYRLWLEPGRLWRRYILGNPVFLARVARQRLAQGRGERARGG